MILFEVGGPTNKIILCGRSHEGHYLRWEVPRTRLVYVGGPTMGLFEVGGPTNEFI
jgi:hypothetical protein